MSLASEGDGVFSLDELANLFVESLRTDAEARQSGAVLLARVTRTPLARSPRVGDLWLTWGTPQDPPTLIALTWVGDEVNRAVIAMDEPDLAAGDDILLSAEQSPLGVPLALCAWRDIPVAEGDLHEFVGALPDSVMDPLAMILQDRITGGFKRRALGATRLSTGEGAVRWRIEPSDRKVPGSEYLAGAPLLDHADPRLRVRQELLRFSDYLERDAVKATAELVLRETVEDLLAWWRSLMPTIAFPTAFRRPRPAFLSIAEMPMALAGSADRELVARLSPGQRVVLRVQRDGRCALINEVRVHERVGIVLADRSRQEVVPLGILGSATQQVLVLASGAQQDVWFDPLNVSIAELYLAVFVSEE